MMDTITESGQELRRRAEELFRANKSTKLETLSTDDVQKLLYELQVHQIELEIQNEELRRLQAGLEASQARFFDLYDLAPVGYLTLSENGLIQEANLAAATMFGVARSVLVKQSISRFILKEDKDIFYLHRKQCFESSTPVNVEIRLARTDDSMFWVHLQITAAQNGEYWITFNDITERIIVEGEREHEALLIQRINTAGDHHEFMSAMASFFLSWSECEAVGIRLRDGDDFPYYETRGFPAVFVKAENNLCHHDPDGKILRDGAGHPILDCMCGNILCGRFDPAKPFFTANGSFWSNNTTALVVSTTEADRQSRTRNRCNGEGYESVALIPLRAGDQVYGLLQLNDHRTNRFTLNKIEHFERMAVSLAIALSRRQAQDEKIKLQEQFQQTQKLESLGVLAGGIAHDFNNILTVIICNCSLLQNKPQMAEELVPEIEIAAQRAADLCRQMLIYAGKAQPVPTRVNMAALVDEMTKMLKATINLNVVIKLLPSTDIPSIRADASQIRQIVMNLIINASEAIGAAQGEIRVSLKQTAIKEEQSDKDHLGNVITPGWYVCLEVTDNGCGMDDETQRRIFEPFYTTKFTGRGLGMSAVLGIIKAHNGALQLFSQSGQGTTFKVYLPLQSSESTVKESILNVSQVPWQGSGTILLVEDEQQLVMVAKMLLKALGFSVIEALNGKEALELYKKNAEYITLVMTDIGMPVMNGYELFRELKKLNPELPIILSSGFGDAGVTSEIPREDMAGILSKPYDFEQLREVLRRVVEDASPLREQGDMGL